MPYGTGDIGTGDSMGEGEAEHVIATYREIAAHFDLKGPVQARVKAKRAGWSAEPQNHPADPLRIRVPRAVWDAGSHGEMESLPQKRRNPRNPPSPTPDLKGEIGGFIKPLEEALEILREQLERERGRADQSELWAASIERRLEEERIRAWAAEAREGELRIERDRLLRERDTERAERDREAAARRAAEDELADWAAGGPLARAWRAFLNRRGRG